MSDREERLARKIQSVEMIPYPEAIAKARKLIQERRPEVLRTNAYAKWRSEGSGAGKKHRYNSKGKKRR